MVGNPSQREAIEFANGAMQVLAGPGSGKTFVIVQRIKYLIEHHNVDPNQILVITFTKAAAVEMEQRFYKLMEQKRLPVTFGTFHAVFYQILRQTGKYRNVTLIQEIEKRKLLLHLLNMPKTPLFYQNERLEQLLRYISQIKNAGGDTEAVTQETFPAEELAHLYNEYNQYLREFSKLDFDDMGMLCLQVFKENPQILFKWQNRYRYILIDEFQDINLMQYEIMKNIAGENGNLFVVGDDDQSIYGFRGARPDIMKKFMADYSNARQVLLDINYRCHQRIVQAAGQVIALNHDRFSKKIRAAHDEGEGIRLLAFPDADKEYEKLSDMLHTLYREKGIEGLNETAIIYRTNSECSTLAEKLIFYDLPFQMKEPLKSSFDHFVIQDLMAYLDFANGNRQREIFHLIMNRPLRYLRKDCAVRNPVELRELLQYYKTNENMQNAARKLFADFDQISSMRPALAIRYIRQVVGYDKYLKETYGPDEFEEFTQKADAFQKLAREYRFFSDLKAHVERCREDIYQKQQEIREKEGTEKPAGIRIMTMHASKGLEFERVFLLDLNEGRLPARQSVTAEEIEEERRMFYVAMTRAKKELYLLYCDQKTGKGIPSRFLEPLLQ